MAEISGAAVEDWVNRYVAAWDSNDAGDIGALFGHDATYQTAPFREPWRGREAIVAGWLDHRDSPGDHEFALEVIRVDGDTAFVRGRTTYPGHDPSAYSNLWVIRFDPDGTATEFTEWWMAEV